MTEDEAEQAPTPAQVFCLSCVARYRRIDPAARDDLAVARSCLEAGWLEPDGSGFLLTDDGRAALAEARAARGQTARNADVVASKRNILSMEIERLKRLGLLGRDPNAGHNSTAETRRQLRSDVTKRLLTRGDLTPDQAAAAEEIREIVIGYEEAMMPGSKMSPDRVDGSSKARDMFDVLPERLQHAFRRVYKPWAEAMNAKGVPGAPLRTTYLSVTIRLVVDNQGPDQINDEFRIPKRRKKGSKTEWMPRATGIVTEALQDYAERMGSKARRA